MQGCRTLCLMLAVLLAGPFFQPARGQEPAARPRFKARRTTASIEQTSARATDSPRSTVVPATATISQDSPLSGFLTRLQASQDALAEVRDYTCLLSKEELIGRKMTSQTMTVKLRVAPFSFYMLFDGANRGREAGLHIGRALGTGTRRAPLANGTETAKRAKGPLLPNLAKLHPPQHQ